MTATLERIKRDLKTLAPSEIGMLIGDLRRDYATLVEDDDGDAGSIEAEWNAEIDERVKEIESGAVALLTAEESERRSDAVFAKLGIKRPVFRP